MTTTGYRPQDVPRLIARQRDFYYSPKGQQFLRLDGAGFTGTMLTEHDDCEGCRTAMFSRTVVPPFVDGEAYFITAQMMQLAAVAADLASNVDLRVSAEDLPSASGVLVFDEPMTVDRLTATACTWSLLPGSVVDETARTLGPDEPRDWAIAYIRLLRDVPDSHRGLCPWLPGYGIPLAIDSGTGFTDTHGFDAAQVARWIISVWQLMMMPRPAQVTVHPTTARERKTAARLGVPPEVRVIDVRPREKAQAAAEVAAAQAEKAGREYHHRWLVRMHWRQQWHPKSGTHKPKLIYPYLKGPEGAPLLTPRPTVKVLDG